MSERRERKVRCSLYLLCECWLIMLLSCLYRALLPALSYLFLKGLLSKCITNNSAMYSVLLYNYMNVVVALYFWYCPTLKREVEENALLLLLF